MIKTCSILKKTGICLIIFISHFSAMAQDSELYSHTTPIEPYITQYNSDLRAINTFYGPISWGYDRTTESPEQLNRLLEIDKSYQDKLSGIPFNKLNTNAQVDFILLKRKIKQHAENIKETQLAYDRIKAQIPFAEAIFNFEKKRRRGSKVNAEDLAKELSQASKQVNNIVKQLNEKFTIAVEDAPFLKSVLQSLKKRLTNSYQFYNEYDPQFTWWVPSSYKELDEGIAKYIEVIEEKGKKKVYEDGSNIFGTPIGKAKLNELLHEEMISYSADELLKLAEKEFAWCEKELLKASNEMGFGNDWKAAQEKVKNSYVPIGDQPELIVKLYNDAQEFIRKNNLMDIPALADETWGMRMMTAEQQLVNPFFLGGREIIISYPTLGMTQEQKMMSMRGNNPYFSRGTVQHELTPGHHLQYFMNQRYKPYREEAFNTPFWTEGWTLYWELLLYDQGFAKSPEERIGMLFWRMHRCARITFSIKFHIGEWTPMQCVDYLVDRVGFERANAHGEIKRSFEGGYGPLYQLAYLVGGLQLMSIKHEIVDSGKMNYKQFHDRVIKENYMPMEMLRAILLDKKLSPDYETSWKFYQFN